MECCHSPTSENLLDRLIDTLNSFKRERFLSFNLNRFVIVFLFTLSYLHFISLEFPFFKVSFLSSDGSIMIQCVNYKIIFYTKNLTTNIKATYVR